MSEKKNLVFQVSDVIAISEPTYLSVFLAQTGRGRIVVGTTLVSSRKFGGSLEPIGNI
jgi:hypothetical protein